MILELEEGDIICSKCKGNTYVKKKISYGDFISSEKDVICDKCWGSGKLTWIENILGKEKKPDYIKDCMNFSLEAFSITLNKPLNYFYEFKEYTIPKVKKDFKIEYRASFSRSPPRKYFGFGEYTTIS